MTNIYRDVQNSPQIKSTEIDGRSIGPGHPCFVIAEAGVNHNGNVENAKKLIDIAVTSKADAVKFQTFNTDLLAIPDAPKAEYQTITTDGEESQTDMLRQLELPREAFAELQHYCESQNIIFLSSPFDEPSVDLLYNLDVPAYKIPSGEAINLPLLKHIGSKQKPIILSTGMSYLEEIHTAVNTIFETGNHDIMLLHCTSNYPAAPADINLNAMETLRNYFGLPVGFSDHTTGIEIPLAAVAMGACIIEKHFTLDKTLTGPDHRASLEPEELKNLITAIRNIELSFGNGIKAPAASELSNRTIIRKSIYLKTSKNAGEVLIESDLVSMRPAGGIYPSEIPNIIGKRLVKSLSQGAMLTWDDVTCEK